LGFKLVEWKFVVLDSLTWGEAKCGPSPHGFAGGINLLGGIDGLCTAFQGTSGKTL